LSANRQAPLVALVLLGCSFLFHAGLAGADPRFGDSSWVAPNVAEIGSPLAGGSRVAPPDHERRWETALRVPFRAAFFPMRLVARGAEAAVGLYGDRFMDTGPKRATKGLSVAPEVYAGGLTEIGVGPAITWAGFPSGDSKLDLSGSWSTTDRRRARLSERIAARRAIGLRLLLDYDFRPNLRFYGVGNETRPADRSIFLLEGTSGEATLSLGAQPLRQLRFVGGYSGMSQRRGYQGQPLLEDVFPAGSLPYERRATRELLYGVTGDFASLDDERDPAVGVHGRGEFRRATGVRNTDPTFNQWSLEGRAYAPVFAKRRVIALRAVYAGVDPVGGSTMPFYRLVQSDGDLRFAGYPSHRFQDRQLLLGRIEYRPAPRVGRTEADYAMG
jgi:hypothetical protein